MDTEKDTKVENETVTEVKEAEATQSGDTEVIEPEQIKKKAVESKPVDKRVTPKKLATAAIIAALYAALTIFIMPASYGVMQLRVSEALTVLPVFTPAAIPGLFIGCMIANIVSPVGFVDIIFGSAATLLAAVCTFMLRKHKLLALLPPVLANAIMVGTELYYFYNVNYSLPACMFWVGLGEAVACYGLGYPLSILLDKHPEIFK